MLADVVPTVPELLRALVAERGINPAIITRQDTFTYRDLDEMTARFARALVAAGAGKGARVGLLASDGPEWLTAFLGSLRIGALVTAISTLVTPSELAHILKHSDCQFLFADRRFLSHDYAATLEAALPALGHARAGAIRLVQAPYLRAVWLDDADGLGWARPISEFLAAADTAGAPDRSLLAQVERHVTPSDDAVVVYTSGSTAMPKAVVHGHYAIVRHSQELARNFALAPDDRMMCLLPLFWLAGMSTATQALSIGAALVYPASPDVEDALDMIEHCGVTRVNAWGDKQPKLIEGAAARGLDLSSIPELSCFHDSAGNPLPPKIPMYGMTESFSAHSAWPLDEPLPAGKEDAFGKAIDDYERRVVDPETSGEVPPGTIGELQIRGPSLMHGFYKARASAVFTPDGFYPTRDLVRIDEDGWLFPAGRIGDMIKTRAANVSRLEVEAALNALPGVAQSVVAGLPDPELGEMVAAGVVQEEGAGLSEESLRRDLRGVISSFKIPRRIAFIDANDIPRTGTGKVRLSELKELLSAKFR